VTDLTDAQLCRDWLADFPLLKRYKSGRKLLRICDPVVYGIELRKLSSRDYRPALIAMCLLQDWNDFGVNEEVRNRKHLQFDIDHEDHEFEYPEAVSALRARFPVLTWSDAGEQAMVDLYRDVIATQEARSESPLSNWGALLELLRYYGREDEFAAEKQKLLAYARTLPPPPLYKGLRDWEEIVNTWVDVPVEELVARRAGFVAKASWDKLPGVTRSPRLDSYERELGKNPNRAGDSPT
jgi:hypothetical protein